MLDSGTPHAGDGSSPDVAVGLNAGGVVACVAELDAAVQLATRASDGGALDPLRLVELEIERVEARRRHLAALLEHREAVIDLEAAIRPARSTPATSSRRSGGPPLLPLVIEAPYRSRATSPR